MSYQFLLKDRCDIYHLKEGTASVGYGLPAQIEHYYEDIPDFSNVPCYWIEANQSIDQQESNQLLTQSFHVHFMSDIDIRVNAKAVRNGITYKLQVPNKIRNHHIEVTAVRSEIL